MKKNRKSVLKPDAKTDIKHIGMKLNEYDFDRIDEHVRTLNCFSEKDARHKREWVLDAIREKLDREQEFSVRNIPQEKHLSIYMDTDLYTKLDERIELIKKLKGGFTKKQWIMAAVVEKLNREEQNAKALLKKLQSHDKAKAPSKTSK